jgi:hypothetical protein
MMSSNTIIVLIYHSHKLLGIIQLPNYYYMNLYTCNLSMNLKSAVSRSDFLPKYVPLFIIFYFIINSVCGTL